MNLNKVILVGRLTRDPEVKSLPSGQNVASFGLATDRFYTDKSNQKQQQVEFHNIVLFGKLADIASQYLKKGAMTLIEGRLQTRTWKDSAGSQRSRTEIVGEKMQLGPKPAGQSSFVERPASSKQDMPQKEDIPVIEEEIDIKDIPF